MLPVRTLINPISGVRIAPPTMAITIREPPILVLGPSPLSPSAKIVGNISDMKKLVSTIAHTPIQLGCSTPTVTSKTLITAYEPISKLGRTTRIKAVEAKRPMPKATRE